MKSPSCPPSAVVKFLIEGPVSLDEAVGSVESVICGAVVVFEGRIRSAEGGRSISAIVYEAYIPMAERVIASIIEEAQLRWPVRAAALHRVGRVAVGETAFLVACAGAHRPEAFEACRFIVDAVKSRATIWKIGFE